MHWPFGILGVGRSKGILQIAFDHAPGMRLNGVPDAPSVPGMRFDGILVVLAIFGVLLVPLVFLVWCSGVPLVYLWRSRRSWCAW